MNRALFDFDGTITTREMMPDLAQYPVIHAYGDKREDRALLALAHRRRFRWQEVA